MAEPGTNGDLGPAPPLTIDGSAEVPQQPSGGAVDSSSFDALPSNGAKKASQHTERRKQRGRHSFRWADGCWPRLRSSLMFSIPSLFSGVAIGVVAAVIAVAFLLTIALIQSDVDSFIKNYAVSTAERAAQHVSRHFETMGKATQVLQQVTSRIDYLSDYPDATNLAAFFADTIINSQLHLLLVNSSGVGFILAPYSLFAPSAFPEISGCIVAQTIDPHHRVTIRYLPAKPWISAAQCARANTSWPLQLPDTFNFFDRPYWSAFCSGYQWSQPYVGVLTRTSAIGLGGPIAADSPSSSRNCSERGVYSFHDFSIDVAAYLQSLSVTPNSRVILVDAATEAYLGGNIEQNSTVWNASGSLVLAKMDDVDDALVHRVISSVKHAILQCANSCSWIFDRSTSSLRNSAPGVITLPINYDIVHVISVTDRIGLDLRLIVVAPSSDFYSTLRSGVVLGLIISLVTASGLLIAVNIGVWHLVGPLRESAAHLLRLIRKPGQKQQQTVGKSPNGSVLRTPNSVNCEPPPSPSGGTALLASWEMRGAAGAKTGEAASSVWCKILIPKEVTVIARAVERLRGEMAVIQAFLPDQWISNVRGQLASTSTEMASFDTSSVDRAISHLAMSQNRDDKSSTPSTTTPEPQVTDDINAYPSEDNMAGSESKLAVVPYVPGNVWTLPVTCVVTDMEGTHISMREMLPSAFQAAQQAYVSVVKEAALRHGGIIGAMYGDRAMIHFNAESRVKGHGAAAVRFMFEIYRRRSQPKGNQGNTTLHATPCTSSTIQILVDSLHPPSVTVGELAPSMKVRMGAATTNAMCGLLGPERLRRFHVVGQCVLRAFALSQHCKTVQTSVLIASRTAKLLAPAHNRMFAFHIGLVVLPYDEHVTIVSCPLLTEDIQHFPLVRRPAAAPAAGVPSAPQSAAPPTRDEILDAFRLNNDAYEAVSQRNMDLAVDILRGSCWTPGQNWLVKRFWKRISAPSPSSNHSNGPDSK